MTKLADYQNKYSYIRFRREDGILEMTIHNKGGPATWSFDENGLHRQMGDAFYDVGRDRDNKVVIIAGTGDKFLDDFDFGGDFGPYDGLWMDRIYKEGKDLLHNLLDIECPVIGTINGNAYIHAEIPLMGDLVIASNTARFADKAHFQGGAVPGDGVHVLWEMWLGPNRSRYFLITGQEIDAKEALQLGLVGEVVAPDKLLPRAWELARDIMTKPELVRRYTHLVLTQNMKRRLLDDLGYGLMSEQMALFSVNGKVGKTIQRTK
jgi:enoyl-CoA hydratase/carnithine racemase